MGGSHQAAGGRAEETTGTMNANDGKERQRTSDAPPRPSPEEGPKGKRPQAPAEGSSDLVVEHWQAPNPSQLRGSSREIWEYENESIGPTKELVITLVVVVAGLLTALGYMGYVIYRFLASPP